MLKGGQKEGSWPDVDEPQDCILAVSDDGIPEIEVVLTDLQPIGKGDAMHVECLQSEEKPNYLVKTMWWWVKSLYWHKWCVIIA